MNELISVIVPVYNTEAYLNQCVQSIIKQTYTDLEIILVDDGSEDHSSEMCDKWALHDGRVKVVHKANGGAASARNAGIAVANGNIIAFVDSDDIIHEEMYSILIAGMKETGCDIVQCEIVCFEKELIFPSVEMKKQYKVFSAKEALALLITDKIICQTPPNKIYKRTIVESIKWPEGKSHEDEFWTYRAIGQSNAVCHIDVPMYFYRQHPQSVMHRQFSIKSLDCMEAIKERYIYIRYNYCELLSLAYNSLFGTILYSCQCALKLSNAKDRDTCIAQIKECYDFLIKQPVAFQSYSKEQVWYIMARISLLLTCHIRNFLGIGV